MPKQNVYGQVPQTIGHGNHQQSPTPQFVPHPPVQPVLQAKTETQVGFTKQPVPPYAIDFADPLASLYGHSTRLPSQESANTPDIQAEFDLEKASTDNQTDFEYYLKVANGESLALDIWQQKMRSLAAAKNIRTSDDLKTLIMEFQIPSVGWEVVKTILDKIDFPAFSTFIRDTKAKGTNAKIPIQNLKGWLNLLKDSEDFISEWNASGKNPKNMIASMEARAKKVKAEAEAEAKAKAKAEAKAKQAKENRNKLVQILQENSDSQLFANEDYLNPEKYSDSEIENLLGVVSAKDRLARYKAAMPANKEDRLSLVEATATELAIPAVANEYFGGSIQDLGIATSIALEKYTYPKYQKDTTKLLRWIGQANHIKDKWGKGTFHDAQNSIIYHYIKHVILEESLWPAKPENIIKYTEMAMKVKTNGRYAPHKKEYKKQLAGGKICAVRTNDSGEILTAFIKT